MSGTMRTAILALAAALLLSPLAGAAERIRQIGPKGKQPDLTTPLDVSAALAQHPMDEERYMEGWNIQARFDTGHMLFANIVLTNMGIGDNRNGSGLTITLPDGKRFQASEDHPEDQLTASRKKFAIRTASTTLRGDADGWELTSSIGDLKAVLKVKATVPGFRWGSGVTYFDEDREEYIVLDYAYPRGTAEGVLTVKGQSYPVKGEAYLDHSVQNIGSESFSKVWYMIRGFGVDGYTVTASGYVTTDDYEPREVYICQVAEHGTPIWRTNRVGLRPAQRKKDPESGYAPPGELRLDAHGYGGRLYGKVVSRRLADSRDVLGSLSGFLRFVIKTFVAKPWAYRYDSEMSLTLELDGRAEPISILGPAIVVVMYVDEE